MHINIVFFVCFVTCAVYSSAQDKCQQVLALLDKVKNACEQFPAQNHCNVFVGRVVKEMYGFDDFVNPGSGTGFFSANQIADRLFIELSDKWDNLGAASSQDVLNKAQNAANSNRCVVAVWRNPVSTQPGHVTIVLPGTLQTGWNGMKVPNAANFAQDAPDNNFVCQRLSGAFAFNKIGKVYLFVRKDL